MGGMATVSPSPGPWIPGEGAGTADIGDVVALGIVGGAPTLWAWDATGMVAPRGGLGAPISVLAPAGAGGLAPHWLQNRAPSGSG